MQYSGDYSLYLRKQTLRTIAAEYAHAGLLPDLLKALGDFLDAPAVARITAAIRPMDDLLVILAGQLASQPAKERYETLKAWTMPTPKRRDGPHALRRGLGRRARGRLPQARTAATGSRQRTRRTR